MAGEGGNAALARESVADQRKVPDRRGWRGSGPPILAIFQDNI
jgi:hypothetical protein